MYGSMTIVTKKYNDQIELFKIGKGKNNIFDKGNTVLGIFPL